MRALVLVEKWQADIQGVVGAAIIGTARWTQTLF